MFMQHSNRKQFQSSFDWCLLSIFLHLRFLLFLPKRLNLISAVFLWFCYYSIFFLRLFIHCRRRHEIEREEMRAKRHSTNEKIMEQFSVCVCNLEGISFLTSIKSKKKYFIDETCFLKFMLMKNKLAADVIHILLGYLKRFYCICHVLREIFFWCEWCP